MWKRALKISGVLLIVLILVGGAIQYYLSNRSKLISYEYDYMTGVISFNIDDHFELISATNELGNIQIPLHNSKTKILFCSLWDIPATQLDRIHFMIRSNYGKAYRFSYELHHGKNTYIEICNYPYANGRMTRTYVDCNCPIHNYE